ncbi:MAG: MEMO1 family protein [Thaumarchaeota archaeon]|nr:MEMO1 family protein [Nitrososphaerota archaeon]
MSVRYPAVAGQFYASKEAELVKSIHECFTGKLGPGKLPSSLTLTHIKGAVMPHAGYMYSGPVAAHGYLACSGLKHVRLAVIVGPNHWGIGSGVATFKEGVWRTPLGSVEVDADAACALVKASGIVDFDETAHKREHSIEVQVPFLQYIFKQGFKILPLSMALQDHDTAVEVGRALAKIVRGRNDVLLIASSDFTHYEPHKDAERKDLELVKTVLELDVDKFYTVLRRLDVTACGYGPVACVTTAMKELGATEAKLLKYATSGDSSGDYSSVVGYASVIFT